MVELGLIQFDERVVGENSPQYDDTLNRALVQIVDESGGDATAFVGFALKPTVAPTIGQFYRATDTVVGASWQTLTAAMVSDLSSASTGITKVGTLDTGVWHGTSIATTYTDAKIASVTGTADRITVGGSASAPTFDIASTYVGQATITTLGTIATGVWNGTAIGVAYTDAKVTVVTGTSNRITIGGTTPAPIIDISAAYVGQTSITTLGTVATGTWNATAIADTYLATISTTGKVSNSATTATAANTAATIVARDGSGNFAAGTITAALTGNVTGNLTGTVLTAAQASITTMTGLVTVGTIGTGVWQGTSISSTYTDAKVASISGTSNRITVGGTSAIPVVDISSAYVGQGTITTLGTVSTGVWQGTAIANGFIATGLDVTKLTTGTTLPSNVVTSSLTALGTVATGVWNGTVVGATYGGTGVNNGSATITLGGSVTFSGAFSTAITVTAGTAVTLPTSGTLVSSTVTSLVSLTTVGVLASPHMTGAVVDSGGFTVTSGTTAVAALTATTISGTVITGTTAGAFGTTPATSGALRLPNDTAGAITFRNANNNGNIAPIYLDAFDGLILGTGAAITYFPGTVTMHGTVNIDNGTLVCGTIQGGEIGGLPKITSGAAPANAASTGTAGYFVWDSGFLYICTATNTWKRVAVATW